MSFRKPPRAKNLNSVKAMSSGFDSQLSQLNRSNEGLRTPLLEHAKSNSSVTSAFEPARQEEFKTSNGPGDHSRLTKIDEELQRAAAAPNLDNDADSE